MLTLWRNHLHKCPHYGEGRDRKDKGKCGCPVWCDGTLNGRRHRKSLETRDWARADRKLAELEDPRAPRLKLIEEAATAFEQHILNLEPSTQRKYRNVLRKFRVYCKTAGLHDVADVTVEGLDAFRASRKISRATSQKELETLRQFFGFCRERNWSDDNPAKRIKSAKNIKPAEVVPYTPEELVSIISACDAIGRGSYERLRARAMVLLLNNTALRVSDVATLARDRVHGGRVLVRTKKTGDTVYLPVWKDTQAALDALPAPRGACAESRYFFWNEITSRRAVVGIAERTLAAVFKQSKVPHAHAHRFRHTLATRLLGMGGTEQEVADILGNSPEIVRKHYAKWSQARQKRIDDLMTAAQVAPGVAASPKLASDQVM
jgi:site-specific recombinase XerD